LSEEGAGFHTVTEQRNKWILITTTFISVRRFKFRIFVTLIPYRPIRNSSGSYPSDGTEELLFLFHWLLVLR